MKLSLLSILLGLGFAVPQVYALVKPSEFVRVARKFPRHLPTGLVLMLLATAWFVWNVHVEPIADFATIKPYMMAGFVVVGIGACIFVQDYLAVRGLAVVLLLLAKLVLDTGRPHLRETHWVWIMQGWAYLWIIAGIWFTISPWRMRDFLNWITATERRVKIGSLLRLSFALAVVALGLTVFRTR